MESKETLAHILEPSGQAAFALRLPFFTAYLISKTDNPEQCIKLALELRDKSDFKDCRVIIHNLQHLTGSNKIEEINGIFKFLKQSSARLMSEYSVSTNGGPQFSLSLGLTGINLSTDMKLGGLFRAYKNRPFARVFRNIVQDMLNVERLGGLHDKLCSSIRTHPNATYPKISATPKYLSDKETKHGRPAKL